jgi:hypothetical protein
MMIWIVTFGLAWLIWRYRWLAHVGWISIFVLAQDAMWPDEPRAKDPAIPEISAPSKSAPPAADTAVHGEDRQGQSSTTTGAQIGRGWQPEYDPSAPAGPYGGSTEEATSTAPPGSVPGRVPPQQTCVTPGVAGPCLQPRAPNMAARMQRGYARPNGAYRAEPRVMDNGGGGGRN